MMISTSATDQRRSPGVSPVRFAATVGTSAAAVYSGAPDRGTLLRMVVVENDTGADVDLTVSVGGVTLLSDRDILERSGELLSLSGMWLEPGQDLVMSGSAAGLVAHGWGLRVEGSTGWEL